METFPLAFGTSTNLGKAKLTTVLLGDWQALPRSLYRINNLLISSSPPSWIVWHTAQMEFPGRGEVVIDNCTDNANGNDIISSLLRILDFILRLYTALDFWNELQERNLVPLNHTIDIYRLTSANSTSSTHAICDTNCFTFGTINIVTQEYLDWKSFTSLIMC